MISNFRKSNGITLIALVVTIIVLLILAGVSISMLLGENGLVQKAQSAAEKSEDGKELDEVCLAVEDATIAGIGELSKNNLKESLASTFGDSKVTDETLTGKEYGPWTFKGERGTYSISADGQVTVAYGEVAERKAPTVTIYPTQADGYNVISKWHKYTSVSPTDSSQANPIWTSYDSILRTIEGQVVNGRNSMRYKHSDYYYTNDSILWSLEFTTNAKEFVVSKIGTIRFSVDEKDGQGYQYINEEGELDLENDKKFLYSNGYDPNDYRFVKVAFEDSKERNIKIEFIGSLANIYTEEQYTITKINKQDNKEILFIGDSWTTGYVNEVELPYRSYPTVIADNLGMTAINASLAGSGYTTMLQASDKTTYQERLEYSIGLGMDPEVIVICGGGNDVTDVISSSGQKTLQNVVDAADQCYKKAKEIKPNAKIIVFGVEYVKNGTRYEASQELKQLNDMLKEKAKENSIAYVDFITGDVIDESGRTIINGTEPFASDSSDLSDSIHLTYDGYKKMANKLTPVVKQLIK